MSVMRVSALFGLVTLIFDLLTSINRFTGYLCDGLANIRLPMHFHSRVIIYACDIQNDRQTDTARHFIIPDGQTYGSWGHMFVYKVIAYYITVHKSTQYIG